MHLNELEIHGFRAFPPEDHDPLRFEGENGVVVGGNGTGKSSVLAAIEFLLTGDMTHLSGPGTEHLLVCNYAPHIDAEQNECYVRGKFETENGDQGTFERKASDPTNLERISGDLEEENVEISQWNDDHLVLTRGKLLNFIEAPAGNRGDKLSQLLNLSGISNRSNGFERICSNLENKCERRKSAIDRNLQDIEQAFDLELGYPEDVENPSDILSEVNERLSELNVSEIDEMDELDDALESLDLSVTPEEVDYFYQKSMQNRLESVNNWVEQNNEGIERRLNELAENLGELESAEHFNIHEVDFFEKARDLVTPETVECPLCGERYEEGYLHERVADSRDRLSHLRELREDIEEECESLRNQLLSHEDEVGEVIEKLNQSDPEEQHPEAVEYLRDLTSYQESLQSLLNRLGEDMVVERDDGTIGVEQISVDDLIPSWSLSIDGISELREYTEGLEPLEETAKFHSELVTVRNAWRGLNEEVEAFEIRKDLQDDLEEVIKLFSDAKREVMGDLYSEIEESFNEYYTTIHPDEQEINLDFEAEGTESVELEAGFEGERDSPLAFHSEGHIDTMGVCLFLALRDRLDNSGPNVVMLDDIIMSVDRSHRRNVARLFHNYLNNGVQGIISTHEEVWADQLKEQGVIPPSNEFKITDWDVSTGPMWKGGSGNPAWDVIEEYLEEGKPHAAAAHLRRQAEKIGNIAALRLRPPIPFQRNFSLGDYISGINGRISEIASGAKGYHDRGSEIWEAAKELDDERSNILGDCRASEMNSMVHYNWDEWGQLEAGDLQGILEHWKDIEDFLYCGECESMIQYSKRDGWKWIECACTNIQVGFEE